MAAVFGNHPGQVEHFQCPIYIDAREGRNQTFSARITADGVSCYIYGDLRTYVPLNSGLDRIDGSGMVDHIELRSRSLQGWL
jgi:hypothetical protein